MFIRYLQRWFRLHTPSSKLVAENAISSINRSETDLSDVVAPWPEVAQPHFCQKLRKWWPVSYTEFQRDLSSGSMVISEKSWEVLHRPPPPLALAKRVMGGTNRTSVSWHLCISSSTLQLVSFKSTFLFGQLRLSIICELMCVSVTFRSVSWFTVHLSLRKYGGASK